MKHSSNILFAIAAATLVIAGLSPASAQTIATSPAGQLAWPADIDPKSGFRLPLPARGDLDEDGQKAFDRGATPGGNIAGLQGPAGISLHSAKTGALSTALSNHLRRDAGLGPRIREIALIVTSRELDNQFEYTAHEPEAVKAGVPKEVIDAIKFRSTTAGLDEADAVIIELGREIWRDHKVTSETFARAKAAFGPRKLIDIVSLMGTHAYTAALLTTFDMQLHRGSTALLPMP